MNELYEKVVRLIAAGAIRDKDLFIDRMAERIDCSAASADSAADELCDLLMRGADTPRENESLRAAVDALSVRVDALAGKIDELVRVLEKKQ